MRGWLSGLGLVCGWVGAVLWAIAVTVLQPVTEPADWAENNTYWVRDVRCMAILAVLAALILVLDGNRIRSGLAALGVVGWFGVDLWLDRIDAAGSTATTWAAAVGCGVVLAALLLGRLAPGRSDPGVLTVAAAVAAGTAPVGVMIESPTDTEPALTQSALALGWLLTALALGCALSASATPTIRRVLPAAGAAIAAAGGVVLVRAAPLDVRLFLMAGLAAVLLTGVAVVSGSWTGVPRPLSLYGLLALGLLVAYPALMIAVVLLTIPVASLFTAIAGNPPVNGADFDTIRALAGLPVGLAVGLFFAARPKLQPFWSADSYSAERRNSLA